MSRVSRKLLLAIAIVFSFQWEDGVLRGGIFIAEHFQGWLENFFFRNW
jgi:hypothetical protein